MLYDLIVVGGGPAGLTAVIYAIRKRLKVLLISKDLGGKTQLQIHTPWVEETGFGAIRGLESVEKFRTEIDYLARTAAENDDPLWLKHTVRQIKRRPEGSFDVFLEGGQAPFQTRAVIVATGAHQTRLEIAGAAHFWLRGLSYSAISHAPVFIDRTVALMGDGDLALRSAVELATVVKKLYYLCDCTDILASAFGEKLTRLPNVQILCGYDAVECRGSGVPGTDYLRYLKIKSPKGKFEELEVDGVFVERQLIPNTEMLFDEHHHPFVELDRTGRIRVDNTARTSLPGVFAAGDVTSGFTEQVLIAVGDGARAALSAYEYLLPMI
jgi:alkyl hydroperoxide reductase subunit F